MYTWRTLSCIPGYALKSGHTLRFLKEKVLRTYLEKQYSKTTTRDIFEYIYRTCMYQTHLYRIYHDPGANLAVYLSSKWA